jgi:enoyl-CoA hydratase/carnithine racemase
MSGEVLVERQDGVLHLTLARPNKRNALTGAMYEVLTESLSSASHDDDIGAILISGSGGAFSAGHDVGDFIESADRFAANPAFRFIKALAFCETPIVAAVEGVAVGVGTTLCLHCDLVYVAPSAAFRMPFVDLGLVPEAASSLLVPQRFGYGKAAEWLLLAEPFGAEEALAQGLANRIVAADALIDFARRQAERLAAKPRQALRMTRRLMRADTARLAAQMDAEAEAFVMALRSPQAQAAMANFKNRRRSQ